MTLKEAIRKLVSDNIDERNLSGNRLGVVTQVNEDNTAIISVDGVGVVATVLYPLVIGQQAVVVVSSSGAKVAAPIYPSPETINLEKSSLFTGLAARKIRFAYSSASRNAIRFQDSTSLIVYSFGTFPLPSPNKVALSPNGQYVAAYWDNTSARTITVKAYRIGKGFYSLGWVDESNKIMNVSITVLSSFTYSYDEAPDADGGVYVRTLFDIWVDDDGTTYGLERKAYKEGIVKLENVTFLETNIPVILYFQSRESGDRFYAGYGEDDPNRGYYTWAYKGDINYLRSNANRVYYKRAVAVVRLSGTRTEIAVQEYTTRMWSGVENVPFTETTKPSYGFNSLVPQSWYDSFPYSEDQVVFVSGWPNFINVIAGALYPRQDVPGFATPPSYPLVPVETVYSGILIWGTSLFDSALGKIVGFNSSFSELGITDVLSISFEPVEPAAGDPFDHDLFGQMLTSTLIVGSAGRSYGYNHLEAWKFFTQVGSGSEVIMPMTNTPSNVGDWATLLFDSDDPAQPYLFSFIFDVGYGLRRCTILSGQVTAGTEFVKIAGRDVFRPGSGVQPAAHQPENDIFSNPKLAYMPL